MQVIQSLPDRKSLPTRGLKGNPSIWIEEKKERDAQLWNTDNSDLWIVENKLYDLKDFVDFHPGGKEWITLTKGQDITEFFIVHHLNEAKARQTLQKYYVRDTKNKLARFSFEENGLYRTVKRRLLQKMTPAQIQDETVSKRQTLILLAVFSLFLLLTGLSMSWGSTFLTYGLAAVCSLLLIGFVGIGHNFIHHKENNFKYLLLITGFTPLQWRIMHCLSHHMYPNLELDYEAAALEPIGYFLRNKPNNFFFTEVLLVFLFAFLQPLNLILKLLIVPLLRRKVPELGYLFPLFIPLIFYCFSFDLWESFKLYVFVYGVYGVVFQRVLFCGHRLQELWSEGAERIEDFGQHTILSTSDSDVSITGLFSYVFLAGFNIHTPHHFFPTADHSKLPPIFELIVQTCKQKKIQKFTQNRVECFKSLSKGIIKRIPFKWQ